MSFPACSHSLDPELATALIWCGTAVLRVCMYHCLFVLGRHFCSVEQSSGFWHRWNSVCQLLATLTDCDPSLARLGGSANKCAQHWNEGTVQYENMSSDFLRVENISRVPWWNSEQTTTPVLQVFVFGLIVSTVGVAFCCNEICKHNYCKAFCCYFHKEASPPHCLFWSSLSPFLP